MRPIFIIVFYTVLLTRAFAQPIQVPSVEALNRVSFVRNDTIYEFYAIKPPEKFRTNLDLMYYWVLKDTIYVTRSAYNGKVLNGRFKVFYPNRMLLEYGNFQYGLKSGLWRAWYQNGQLRETIYWKNGIKSGSFKMFDSLGKVTMAGGYRNGQLHGKILKYDSSGNVFKMKYQKGVHLVKAKEG